MQENSQILQQVGGPEAAKRIVDGAPDGATHFLFDSALLSADYLQYVGGGSFNVFVGERRQMYLRHKNKISLKDLRIAIGQAEINQLMTELNQNAESAKQALSTFKAPELTSFKVGDRVVAIGGDCTEIFEIDRKGRDGSFWDTRWRMLNIEIFRHATPEEIAAGHRIDSQSDINVTHSSKSIANTSVAASESDTLDVDSRHISPDCHVFSDLPELQAPPKSKPKPLYTHNELVLMHKIEHLRCSLMAWRIACAGLAAVAFCAYVGWLS